MDIDFFADLANIGTLFAFVFVSCAVIILRRTQPDRPRSFKVPFCPVTPILSVVCCLGLMLGLPLLAWMGFVVWLIVGLAIYFMYGNKRSLLGTA
jgi:APA family basic amino acid/polyamine antiporter